MILLQKYFSIVSIEGRDLRTVLTHCLCLLSRLSGQCLWAQERPHAVHCASVGMAGKNEPSTSNSLRPWQPGPSTLMEVWYQGIRRHTHFKPRTVHHPVAPCPVDSHYEWHGSLLQHGVTINGYVLAGFCGLFFLLEKQKPERTKTQDFPIGRMSFKCFHDWLSPKTRPWTIHNSLQVCKDLVNHSTSCEHVMLACRCNSHGW